MNIDRVLCRMEVDGKNKIDMAAVCARLLWMLAGVGISFTPALAKVGFVAVNLPYGK